MEEIAIPGYTPHEKVQIGRRHLLPRQLNEHGLSASRMKVSDTVLALMIDEYTREAGVRNLERELGALCRKSARQIVEGRKGRITITKARLTEFLGPQKFYSEVAEGGDEVGVATGLAATAVGGEILFIEATRMKGRKNLILTGQLGDVMQESAQTALSYLKSRADELGIDATLLDESDIHLHVPAGATPKEGPSAGVALAVALTSMLTGKPVRRDVAMTGEITLRGRVLPVGGIRDKVLAAQRAGIRTVLLPRRNENDLEEVPEEIRESMKFILVDDFDTALAAALASPQRRQRSRSKKPATPRRTRGRSR
jgi:ATP-dependent Lon protease